MTSPHALYTVRPAFAFSLLGIALDVDAAPLTLASGSGDDRDADDAGLDTPPSLGAEPTIRLFVTVFGDSAHSLGRTPAEALARGVALWTAACAAMSDPRDHAVKSVELAEFVATTEVRGTAAQLRVLLRDVGDDELVAFGLGEAD